MSKLISKVAQVLLSRRIPLQSKPSKLKWFTSQEMMHCTFNGRFLTRGNAFCESIMRLFFKKRPIGKWENYQFASFFEASSKFSTRSERQRTTKYWDFVLGPNTQDMIKKKKWQSELFNPLLSNNIENILDTILKWRQTDLNPKPIFWWQNRKIIPNQSVS